ncbi:MAG: hypothetical protein EKK41_00160 [Hyphomicrobiales bacterium]|nr:MAG: hypothetical protein EKK41_00160 [Hyphomicrobiales bacterium]
MLPNISSNGRSFRGAGAYYLHDKAEPDGPKPTTSERVAWTATRNLAQEDPSQALDEMWHTAEDGMRLRREAGQRSGTRCEAPVKTISLAWAPHQSPTRAQMEATADHYLRYMGWHEHQALYVAHNDTAHPHLHIILNKVHPETGLTLNDWKDWERSQRWGLLIEREQGAVLCLARVEKYEQAFDLQTNGLPYPYAKLAQEQDRAFASAEQFMAAQEPAEKDLLAQRHQEERKAFLASGKAAFRAARQQAYQDVRAEFKPQWRAHFRAKNEGEQNITELAEDTAQAVQALTRSGDYDGAQHRLALLDDYRETTRQGFAAQGKALRGEQLQTTRTRQDEACQALIAERRETFQDLKDRQKEQRHEVRDLLAAREAGTPHDANRLVELLAVELPLGANDNRQPELAALAKEVPDARAAPDSEPAFNPFSRAADELFGRHGYDVSAERAPNKDITDVIAAPISAVIEFGVRAMDSLFAPPSPLEQAIAKAWSVRAKEDKAEREEEARAEHLRQTFIKHGLTAVRAAQEQHDKARALDDEERGRERTRHRDR